MTEPKNLRFYLEDKLLRAAQDGTHNFLAQLISVTEDAGFQTELCPREQGRETAADGYSIFHDEDPGQPGGLTFRRVYHGSFWTIEKSSERWASRVALRSFNSDKIDPNKAKTFYERWQRRVFRNAPAKTSHEGFVYVPLQDQLIERRGFQMASPIEMIMSVLHHEPNRRVIVTLHPRENYSMKEQNRLQQMQDRFSNLQIQKGGMIPLLQSCDYVVTQNSAVAFNGYFFGKPSILFGKTDFHHIALNVEGLGVSNAFEQVHEHRPDYARFIYWFWHKNSINAGRPVAEEQIAQALRREGWPL
ncbi:hypothetical protein [Thalassovita sp.]|jgi:hypothetical protein|uniref:capsular polysaccharide export protein, LipB/KpsS family n=1 Tax=Thalassovita sp. TaxID=1979401 RepID=UPI003B58EE9D